tara:strand:+ start:541 stop:681 length:141 start_codon:yes stop_codon:yes gene_type:complete
MREAEEKGEDRDLKKSFKEECGKGEKERRRGGEERRGEERGNEREK